ncbi:MAG: galactokinase [Patescibacteria group bacterium]
MILTRTPFRLQLGGGSTDLPAYYQKHGGFIFAATINLYMYIGVNRPPIDALIRVKYSHSEEVSHIMDLKHELARGALQRTGIGKMIEITSKADIPAGTGLGSSGSYLVGLLNALHTLKGENVSRRQLAEEAFEIAIDDLGLPDGKQDFYAAAFGNFSVFEIEPSGIVHVRNANVSRNTQREFEERTLLFYTGVRRSSGDILREQQQDVALSDERPLELKHQTKAIGRQILDRFETGNLNDYGDLLHQHWETKKQMSSKMSTPLFDEVYDKARQLGALGGKIQGAGGGGFFMIHCRDGAQDAVKKLFAHYGMRAVPWRIDSGGTQVILNRSRDLNTI